MKKLLAFLFETTDKRKDFYNGIGKPEQHPQSVKIQSTTVPAGDFEFWMKHAWTYVPFMSADYKLLPRK